MEQDVLQFDLSAKRCMKIAENFAEKGEYEKALGLLFVAKKSDCNQNVITALADTYADMGLLEQSNRYWFKYLDTATPDKMAMAYEELAINYFYLDDFWASSYYFHKKIDTDGFLSKDGIDQEILDFFTGEEHRKAFYHVAYPFDRADYSGKVKLAKHGIASGKFNDAVKILENIPVECRDEDLSGDLATAYFMSDNLDQAATICRESLANHGDSVTAYCNLSTVYDMKEDYEKSEYYYKKALECRKGERTEAYKIATCAIEREDHKTAKECLKTILEERPYDLAMRFFYGITQINLGEYDLAEQTLSRAYRLDPEDVVIKYYLDLVKALKEGGSDAQKLLPLKYVKEVPEKIERSREKIIKELVKHPEKISSAIKRKDVKEILKWALKSKKSDTVRETAYVLSSAYDSFSKKLILSSLLDNETLPELKRVLVYALTVNGYKEKYGVVAGGMYIKVKPKKLSFEKDDVGGIYVRAYALAMSRAVFWNLDNVEKLASSATKVFRKLNNVISETELTGDELASLMVYNCHYEKFENDGIISHLFDIKKERFKEIKKLLDGDKNDKNN